MTKKGLFYTACVFLFFFAMVCAAETETEFLGDQFDGSRAKSVHLIPLYDSEGEKISLSDDPLMPFSTRQTCGQCHDYDKISKGWHFNAMDPNVDAGKAGQPWVYVDVQTATQIPLSYRNWPGLYRPEDVGLTTWQFMKKFSRQMPGGGAGEVDSDDPDEMMRSFVSGKLEINCLACHEVGGGYDQAEYVTQLRKENYMWAAASACGFADASGSAKNMPDTYDPLMPGIMNDPKLIPPAIEYKAWAFDSKKRVQFNIVKNIPAEKCFFCHSSANMEMNSLQKGLSGKDVHLAAGLGCVDCHRNELGHNITRGDECSSAKSENALAATASCEGCHLGEGDSNMPSSGRLGAPRPVHAGIPVVHFEKLSCTACHSGLWPGKETSLVKTSMGHALGTLGSRKNSDALPHIVTGVFAEGVDGKIAPGNIVWPAFWGQVNDGKVSPLNLDIVKEVVVDIINADVPSRVALTWPEVTEEKIASALIALKNVAEGSPAYVAGGKLYSLDGEDKLVVGDNDAAAPYRWSIGHDVRPAEQSLGVRRCEDCHSVDQPFSFGSVVIDGPMKNVQGTFANMMDFQDVSPLYMKLFAMSFVFRPIMKTVVLLSCAVVAFVLLFFALRALSCVVRAMAEEDE